MVQWLAHWTSDLEVGVQAWSLLSFCFLRQETLFQIVSLHPDV